MNWKPTLSSFATLAVMGLLTNCTSHTVQGNVAEVTQSGDRDPASMKLEDPAQLETLYADYSLDPEEIQQKIVAAKDALQLLRSFIPLYYDIAQKSNPVPELAAFTGKSAGDAHLENFGSSVQADGSMVYALNDYDDSAIDAPVYLDIVRLITSLELSEFKKSALVNKDVSKDMLAAYREGVAGKEATAPAAIHKLLAIKAKGAWAAKGKYVSKKGEFTSVDTGAPLKPAESAGFLAAMQKFLKDAGVVTNEADVTWSGGKNSKFVPAFKRKIYDGGAGGLERVTGALTWKGAPNAMMVFEVKEMATAGSYSYDNKKLVINKVSIAKPATLLAVNKRLRELVEWARGKKASPYVGAIAFDKKIYALRLRLDNEDGLEFDDLDDGERKGVLTYQANLLGLMHRNSLKTAAAKYHASLEKIGDAPIVDAAEAFAKKFELLHRQYQQ